MNFIPHFYLYLCPSPLPLWYTLSSTHTLCHSLSHTHSLFLSHKHTPPPHTHTHSHSPLPTLYLTHTHTHTQCIVEQFGEGIADLAPSMVSNLLRAFQTYANNGEYVQTTHMPMHLPVSFRRPPIFFLWTVKENFVSLESLLVFCCSGYTLFSRFSSHHVSAPSSFLFEYYLPPIPSHFWTPIFALESSCWYLSDTELSPLLSSLFSSLFFPFPLADDDDEGAFSACQCLDTIGSVLDAVQERGDIMAQLEVIVIPMMMKWVPCYFKWCDLMWNRVM